MIKQSKNEFNNFGDYKPKGFSKVLLLFVSLGLGRGKIKHFLAAAWRNRHHNTPVDVEYHGIKLRMHPWESSIESKILFGSKLREKDELDELKNILSKDSVFLDVGANIGYYTLMAASMGARVIAIEPNPVAFERLAFNILANGFDSKVTKFQIGLSDKVGVANLNIPGADIGSASIVNPAIHGKTIQINLEPLKEVLDKASVKSIEAMKIDVEGMEDLVLFPFYENTSKDRWPKLVIIEETSQNLWKRNILAWMLEHGYKRIGKTRGNAILKLETSD